MQSTANDASSGNYSRALTDLMEAENETMKAVRPEEEVEEEEEGKKEEEEEDT
jgi:hypothetical protein